MPYFLSCWFSPRDSRWHGSQRAFLPLTLLKISIFIPFLVLCIVEIALWRKWVSDDGMDPDRVYTSDDVWGRWAGIVIIPEGIHIVLQLCLIPSDKFHPGIALSGAVIMFVAWALSAFLNALLAYSSELFFVKNSTWDDICYAETGIQGVVALIYAVLIVLGAIAVHRSRKAPDRSNVRMGEAMKGNSETKESV